MSLEDILMDAAEEVYDTEMGKKHINQTISFEQYDDDFNDTSNTQHDDKDVLKILQKSANIVSYEEDMETKPSLHKISDSISNKIVISKPIAVERVVNDDEVHKFLAKADAEVEQKYTAVNHIPEIVTQESSSESDHVSEEEDDVNENHYAHNHDFFMDCYHGKIANIEKHCERGADLKYSDRHGWNVFHWVAAKGLKNVLLCLVKEYDTRTVRRIINSKDTITGWTPLHVHLFFMLYSIYNHPHVLFVRLRHQRDMLKY